MLLVITLPALALNQKVYVGTTEHHQMELFETIWIQHSMHAENVTLVYTNKKWGRNNALGCAYFIGLVGL